MDILAIDDLEEFVDENQAFIISRRFQPEAVQRALELAREGYQMELQDGAEDDRLDHFYISMTLLNDDDEIEDQIVINTSLIDEGES